MASFINVKLDGFKDGVAELQAMADNFEPAVHDELQKFGNEVVDYLQDTARSSGFNLPPKARPDGNPPLIHLGIYIDSYVAVVEDWNLGIISEGNNTRMSNADLAELLEFGWGDHPAMPHLRPTLFWMEKRANVLGGRIFDAISSHR